MPDSEKITVNLGAVDLGKIDLLVQEGIYSNRTDFIRAAIRTQTEKHSFEVQQAVARHSFVIGVLTCGRRELEHRQEKREKLKLTVIGVLTIAKDVPAELAKEVIESVHVRGVFNASDAVKAALADRML